MPDALHQLIYYSRNRIEGSPQLIGAEVRTILAASQRNNAPIGVTGALMFNAGCFAQILEGKRSILESTFERIQQDDRHGEVSLLAFEPITVRTFTNWSMAFVGTRPEDATAYQDIAASSGFDPAKASGEQIFQALHNLALEEEAALM